MGKRRGWILFFLFTGFFLFMGFMFILGIKMVLEDKPIVRKNTVLQLNLVGQITEQYPRDVFSREFEGANLQMHDIRKALAMGAIDNRISGVFMRIAYPGLGWAKAKEIRDELNEFKKSGKFVTAYIDFCDEQGYYIALAADDIYLQPHTRTELNGFKMEIPFIKHLLNNLGIKPQVVHTGKFKSYGDIYSRESMTPEHRKSSMDILNAIYENFVQTVVAQRNIARTDLERMLSDGVYKSERVFEYKLVDGLKYESDIIELIKEKIYGSGEDVFDQHLNLMPVSRYAKVSTDEVGLGRGSKIALIYAVGTIYPGYSGHDPLNGRTMGSQSVVNMLRAASEDDDVHAVVIRVDSPGGSGVASDEIWAEIDKVKKQKPVVISMGDVAASGGYWISMGCDAIVAQPLTITGSIGVVSMIFDMSGTFDKLGINWETVKTNRYADMLTNKQPLSPYAMSKFEELNRDFYQFFVQKVADGRNKTWDEVDEIAQGRTWIGQTAFELGLVDTLGGLNTALAIAKEKAGLKPEDKTQWIVYPQPKGFFQSLFEKLEVKVLQSFQTQNPETAFLKQLPQETKVLLRQLALLYQLSAEEIIAFAPFIPEIK